MSYCLHQIYTNVILFYLLLCNMFQYVVGLYTVHKKEKKLRKSKVIEEADHCCWGWGSGWPGDAGIWRGAGDRTILYLDCSVGYTTFCICQSSKNYSWGTWVSQLSMSDSRFQLRSWSRISCVWALCQALCCLPVSLSLCPSPACFHSLRNKHYKFLISNKLKLYSKNEAFSSM